MDSVLSILVIVAIVKYVNRALQFRLALVCTAQGLVMAPDIPHLLYAEGAVDTPPTDL